MLAIGLMSGTSLDGMDAALVDTDGERAIRSVAFSSEAYAAEQRRMIAAAVEVALRMDRPGDDPAVAAAERMLTDAHAALVARLLAEAGVPANRIEVVGFHGQTVAHRPDRGWTWQIGDGARLAALTGIAVVDRFRATDVAAGGQGAPLLPVYHRALLGASSGPAAVLNLGGVGNLTWIDGDRLVAFDTGPANGLIDQWVERITGEPFDRDGRWAAEGRIDEGVLHALLDRPWFDLPPPKSLDRHDFTDRPVAGLSLVDGAATLARFTAETVALALRQVPCLPERLVVAGGGRCNPTLMAMIADACAMPAVPVEALGWNGDATEAEGFAYMAVRSLAGRPISFPGTTGVPRPLTGGTLHRPVIG